MNDLIGKRFGRLTVLYDSKRRYNRSIIWSCICECGKITSVRSGHLKNGAIKSCGCLLRESTAKRFHKHGESYNRRTRLYNIWANMKHRCYNSRISNYKYYGAKGIRICDEWKDNYSAFKFWAILNGYQDELTIDRINPRGNYEPSNCQWLTRSENAIKGNLERTNEKTNTL